MALTRVGSKGIAPGAVDTNDLSDNTITSAKILGTISIEKGGTGLSNVGPTGNVLTSNGTAWISQELVIPAAPNGFASVQVFSTVGNVTWTKPANLVRVKVTVVGGGGAGFRDSPQVDASGGGGGGVGIKFIPAPTIPGPVTVTVGSGGRGRGNGNTSSFGAFVSATGGTTGTSSPAPHVGQGGTGVDGDLNIKGEDSRPRNGPGNSSIGGSSGLSFGFGGFTYAPGKGFGGGGGGAYVGPGGTPGVQLSLGANGAVIVEEFF